MLIRREPLPSSGLEQAEPRQGGGDTVKAKLAVTVLKSRQAGGTVVERRQAGDRSTSLVELEQAVAVVAELRPAVGQWRSCAQLSVVVGPLRAGALAELPGG